MEKHLAKKRCRPIFAIPKKWICGNTNPALGSVVQLVISPQARRPVTAEEVTK